MKRPNFLIFMTDHQRRETMPGYDWCLTPALDVFARLTEAQLRNRLEPEKGVFIAESPKVISRAVNAGCEPVSFLLEPKMLGDSADSVNGDISDEEFSITERKVSKKISLTTTEEEKQALEREKE